MTGNSQKRVSSLIEGIYDASLDHSRWQQALREVTDFVGGTGAILYSHNLAANAVSWAIFTDMDPEAIQAYERYYAKIDARYDGALKLPTGTVLTENRVMESRALAKTEFYQDFLRPYDIPHICASVLFTEPEFVAISVQGGHRHGPFAAAEMERLELLIPHISRAVRIGNLLETHRRQIGSLQELLNTFSMGVVALDRDGRILEMNVAASAAVGHHDAFACHGLYLQALSTVANANLKRAIFSVLQPREAGENERHPGIVSIPRQDGQRGYTVLVERISNGSSFTTGSAGQVAAFALLIDHDATPPCLAHLLACRFGLTPSEADVAQSLYVGRDAHAISEERNTSVETVRSQIKAVLTKCGVNTQAQFIRLAAELAHLTLPEVP